MNKQIRRLGLFLVLCYVALFVKLNQVQVLEAEKLNEDPLNARRVVQQFNRPRGLILSAEGAVLAESIDNPEKSEFERRRVYPTGDLFGHITGYFSFKYGSSGVEKSYDEELTGGTLSQQIESFRDLLVNKENVGNVKLTVRRDLQQLARDQLGSREGSVVVLDPRSGDILAFWSNPSYDPNLLSETDQDKVTANWDVLNALPGRPMRAHQYQDRYFPGSTFKLVTAGTGLQTGKVSNDQPVYPSVTSYLPPQTNRPISNFGGGVCGGSLPVILRRSCNSSFAEMGQATLGPEDMVKGAQAFGFNQDVPIDLPAPAQSSFPKLEEVAKNPPKLAQASIGQNDVQATPLQMALVAAGVANDGVIMKPHVMSEVTDSEGNVVARYEPGQWLRPLDPQHAATLRDDMYGVVSAAGTAPNAAIPGYLVGGKTGTAQLGDGDRLHTWFVAFAGLPGQTPTVAVAVVVLNVPNQGNESTGGAIAAPIARAMMERTLTIQAGGS